MKLSRKELISLLNKISETHTQMRLGDTKISTWEIRETLLPNELEIKLYE